MQRDRLTALERALLRDLEEEISYVFGWPEPHKELARSLSRLSPGALVSLYRWDGQDDQELVILGCSAPEAGLRDTEWVQSGLAVKSKPYDPRKPFHLANQFLSFDSWAGKDKAAPESLRLFRELALQPSGLGPYSEAVFYDKETYLACCSVTRDKSHRTVDKTLLKVVNAVTPEVCALLSARQALETVPLAPGDIAAVAEAIETPAFLVTGNGGVVYANQAARFAYPRYPVWIRACVLDTRDAVYPPSVRRVPLSLDGLRLYLLLPDRFVLEPEQGPDAPWARRWGLAPRLARVAVLLMQGLSDKEIARHLGLRLASVRTYVRQIYTRADVHGRSELTAKALRAPQQKNDPVRHDALCSVRVIET